MSKARSPREVCSTTIGTSGLIERASLATGLVARSPDLPGALFLLLLGRPELLACRGLVSRDWRGAVDEQVDRLAHRDVLTQRLVGALGACALERALDLLVAGIRPGGLAQRLLDLLIGDLDALGGDDRRQHRLALERLLGVGRGFGHELLLLLADHLEVLARVDALLGQPARGAVPHFVRLR